MKNVPKKPGRYVEFTSRDGYVKYAPLTQAMAERRNAIAKALGYVLPEKCTLRNGLGDNGRRFDCWERVEQCDWRGTTASVFHSIFTHDLSRYGAPSGAVGYHWPEDVEKAAYAIDRRRPLPDDPADADEKVQTQASLVGV